MNPFTFALQAAGATKSTEIPQGSQNGYLPTVNTDLSLKCLCNKRRKRGSLVYSLMAFIELMDTFCTNGVTLLSEFK